MSWSSKRADRLWAKRQAHVKFWAKHGADRCQRCGVTRGVHHQEYLVDTVYQLCCKKFKEGE